MLVLLGEVLALSGGITWMFGRWMWEQAGPADPGILLVQEVFQALTTSIPWTSRIVAAYPPPGRKPARDRPNSHLGV